MKREVDRKVMKAQEEDKIDLFQRDSLLKMGNFFYDVFMSYYSNRYTTYMDSKFTRFPAMSNLEWLLRKFENIFKL